MAEIQMREERLKALEDAHRAKQQGRRQVVNPGFSVSFILKTYSFGMSNR